MRRLTLFLSVLLVSSACQAQRSPTASPVSAQRGMVVSAEHHASAAGVEVMRGGGNAVDAAVATGFALAVTFPVAGNVGGGGFMVIRFPDGTATTVDYRETAPSGATREMYVDDSTGAIRPDLSRRGALASGVPGAVAGLLHAHAEYGRAPLAAVLAPAIRLAADGFPLSPREADRLTDAAGSFARYPGSARHWVREGGWAVGDTLRQPELAAVLERIRDDGRDGFYTGETARLIVAEQERGGGLISLADLAGYQPVERAPLVGDYRGHRVISMPPPSSGGIALIQMLDAVESFDVSALGFNSSATAHLMGEAMRRAFADRAEWLGDPDFSDIPTDALTAESYTRARMVDFDPAKADSSVALGAGQPRESDQTTHYSVVDADGLAVSTTTTLNGGFGSHVAVQGAGFFLNNEMDDFTSAPGQPNMFGLVQGEANAIEPGKRMLSSMTPTIVEDPEGRLMLVVGSPGGPRIITAVFQTILNVVDHGMNVQEAVAAPRVHHQWLPDVMYHERQSLPVDVIVALQERGWQLSESAGWWGRVDAIEVGYDGATSVTDPSGLDAVESVRTGRTLLGGADPRGEDAVAGY